MSLPSADLVDEDAPSPCPPPLPSTLPAPSSAPASAPLSLPPATRRMGGEELVATVFEKVHAMYFLGDALEATRFALTVLADAVPCRASLVHFFDVTRKEFVVVDAHGEGACDMVLTRHGVKDPLLGVAMPLGAPFFWNDLSNAPVRSIARFANMGEIARALVCPIVLGGRWMAAIELVDPLDGAPFDSDEEHAAAYVARHLADFLQAQGVIVDTAVIARFAFNADP